MGAEFEQLERPAMSDPLNASCLCRWASALAALPGVMRRMPTILSRLLGLLDDAIKAAEA